MPILQRLFLFLLCLLTTMAHPLISEGAEEPGVVQQTSTESLPIEHQNGAEEADKFTGDLLNMLMTLLFFIFFILALSWFLKRMLQNRQQQANVLSTIKVLEHRSLSAKATIYILDIAGETLAVAETPSGVSVLTKIAPEKSPFRQILEGEEKVVK